MATKFNNQISVPMYPKRRYIGRKDKFYVFFDEIIVGNLIIAEKVDLDDLTLFSINKNYQKLNKTINEYRQNRLIDCYFGIKLFEDDEEYSFFYQSKTSTLITLNLIDSIMESLSLNDIQGIFDFLLLTNADFIKLKENWYKIYEEKNEQNDNN